MICRVLPLPIFPTSVCAWLSYDDISLLPAGICGTHISWPGVWLPNTETCKPLRPALLVRLMARLAFFPATHMWYNCR